MVLIPSTGIVNYEDVKNKIMKSLDDVREEDKVNHLRLYYDMGVAMSNAAMECMVFVLQNARDREHNVLLTTLERMNKPEEKQLIFNTKEAMAAAKIKSMTTMIKYLNDGTIKGTRTAKGEWTIKREAIAEYLGVNDF